MFRSAQVRILIVCLSFDTPLKHLFECKHSTIDQLTNVRKEKHNQYMAFLGENNVSVNMVNESFSPVCPVSNNTILLTRVT